MQPCFRAATAKWSAGRHLGMQEGPDQLSWSAPGLQQSQTLILTGSQVRLCIETGARPCAADAAAQCDAPLGWLQELLVVEQCQPVRAKVL